MELSRLRAFLAVVEAGSITAAARRLHITQPALSRQLRLLERALGTPLLERSARGVTPTTAGLLLAARATAVVTETDRLKEDLRRTAAASEPVELTVGVFLGAQAAAELTGAVLGAFRHSHPHVRLRLRPLALQDPWGLDVPELDVLLYRQAAPGDLCTPLFEEHRTATVSRRHPLADSPSLTIGELAGHVLQDSSSGQHGKSGAFFRFHDCLDLLGADDSPRYRVPLTSHSALLNLVADDRCIHFMAGSAARQVDHDGLVSIPLTDIAPSVASVAVRRPTPVARAFARTAVETAHRLRDLVPEAHAPGALARAA